MLNDARGHLFDAPHMVVYPALAVMIAVPVPGIRRGLPLLPYSVAIARAPGLCCVAIVKARHASLHPLRLSSTAFYWCAWGLRSEEHTSELQSRLHLVCRLLLEKKKALTTYNL